MTRRECDGSCTDRSTGSSFSGNGGAGVTGEEGEEGETPGEIEIVEDSFCEDISSSLIITINGPVASIVSLLIRVQGMLSISSSSWKLLSLFNSVTYSMDEIFPSSYNLFALDGIGLRDRDIERERERGSQTIRKR